MVKVGIVGGTGYTGIELLRLLAHHPQVELIAVTSRQEAGTSVAKLFPSLRGKVELAFTSPDAVDLTQCDVVCFATPNGVAMTEAPSLLAHGVRVIDLAADFRLKNVAEWEQWYQTAHQAPEWLAHAVYGLPEVNRTSIRTAQLVANPGCYPTAVQLGFLPLLAANVIAPDTLIADCKSGVSGAGRRAEVATLFSEVADSMKAYGVGGHRHLPEIQQGLATVAGQPVSLTFVPHLTPMIRGIHATLYATLTQEVDVQALYEAYFANEPFVDVLPAGSCPETRTVRGANLCRLAVYRVPDSNRVVVLSVIDNLVKGASGQAIQNLNLMFGFAEDTGLTCLPLLP